MNRNSSNPRFLSVAGIAAALVCCASIARASAPDYQIIKNGREVLIYNDYKFRGSGTIIANHDIKGKGYFCIVTADHVISNGYSTGPMLDLSAGFNIPGLSGHASFKTVTYNSIKRFGGIDKKGRQKKDDIAVFQVKYGDWKKDYNAYVAKLGTFSSDKMFKKLGGYFTSEGFGSSAKPHVSNDGTWFGYNSPEIDAGQRAELRFENNVVDKFDTANYLNYDFLSATARLDRWEAKPGSDNFWVNGEGVVYPGDSGGGWFISDRKTFTFTPSEANLYNGPPTNGKVSIPYYDNTLIGITDFKDNSVFGSTSFSTSYSGGLVFDDALKTWIQQSCSYNPTPESSPIAAISLGIGFMLASRRRRRK